MKKILFALGLCCFGFSILGCSAFKKLAPAAGFPAYSGPKAKIVVADFELQTAKAGVEVASGLRQMLLAALNNSNRFFIVDRQKSGAAADKVADLIISTTVTEFEPQSSGGSAGIGSAGGAASGNLGGLLGVSTNKAHLSLDVRVIDTANSQVVAATRVQGQAAETINNPGAAAGLSLGEGLTAYVNTPMEKAIRLCITEAVRFISLATSEKYYKY